MAAAPVPPKLSITPPDTELKPNSVCRFKVNPPGVEVEWSINPKIGTIGQDGIYTSPDDVDMAETIKVFAKARQGGDEATAVVRLADSSKCVSVLGWYAVSVAGVLGILLLSLWACLHKGPTAPVVVVNPPAITLDPTDTKKDHFTFSATVLGDTNNDVNWSVDPATAGTIDSSGNFHPTHESGSAPIDTQAKIIAQSKTDPSRSGAALVNLISGTNLEIYPYSMSTFPGQQVEFRLTVKPEPKNEDKTKQTVGTTPPANVQNSDTTPSKTEWTVEPKSLASVTQEGVFTAGTPAETSVVTVNANGPTPHARASVAVVISVPFRPNPVKNWPIILFVITCGALGSMIYFTSSFVAYVGNRTFRSSWFWFYISRPFVGGGLAVIFFFLVEWGKISGASGTDLATVGAISALVGLFSDKAVKKLSDILDVLLATKDDRKDKIAPDSKTQTQVQQTAAPAKPGPKITSIAPNSAAAGSGVNPQITGTNLAGATVTVNGEAATPTDATDTSFKLAIAGDQVIKPRVTIAVSNGQVSDSGTITVT